jgi:Tol biopolymer transport system component
VAYLTNASGAQNVRVLSLDDSTDAQLTFMRRDVLDYAWSPDGLRIAFTAWDGDSLKVWTVPARGGTPAPFKHTLVSESGDVAWSPGHEVLYQVQGNRNFNILDPSTGFQRSLVHNDSVGWMFQAEWSPDQKHVALVWNRRPNMSLWVVSTADTTQQRLSPLHELSGVWDRSGGGILMRVENSIVRISYPVGDTTTVLRMPFKSISEADFTPDLLTVVYTIDERSYDVWLVENFDPEVK